MNLEKLELVKKYLEEYLRLNQDETSPEYMECSSLIESLSFNPWENFYGPGDPPQDPFQNDPLYILVLKGLGSCKKSVAMFTLRKSLSVSISELNDMLSNLPLNLIFALSLEEAQKIARPLTNLGLIVDIVEEPK